MKKESWFKKNVVSLIPALLLVLVVRSSVIEAFKIPSGSMTPTLIVGDRLFVNKLSYGVRVPLWELFSDHAVYFFKYSAPSRGDIIVFNSPEDPSIYLIKRIVGIPGDTIEMKDKAIYVNGKAMNRTPIPEAKQTPLFKTMEDFILEYPPAKMRLFYDEFDHTTATVMIDSSNPYSTNFEAVKVPEGHYFFMGDNRDNSKDSRYIGFVPFDMIKGRAAMIWLSSWIDFETKTYLFHPERIGTILH